MIKINEGVCLKDYTLIVACVSVGNVAQLAADLLITSLEMRKAGKIWHPAFMPVIGASPYEPLSHVRKQTFAIEELILDTASELYYCSEKKVCIMQMRSCLEKHSKREFLNELAMFVIENSILQVVILTSCFGHKLLNNLENVYFGTTGLNFMASQKLFENHKNTLNMLNWVNCSKELFNESSVSNASATSSIDLQRNKLISSIPGYANDFYNICETKNISAIMIFKYCSEGDNAEDAIRTTKELNNWINILRKDINDKTIITIPMSWKMFYGNTEPKELF